MKELTIVIDKIVETSHNTIQNACYTNDKYVMQTDSTKPGLSEVLAGLWKINSTPGGLLGCRYVLHIQTQIYLLRIYSSELINRCQPPARCFVIWRSLLSV